MINHIRKWRLLMLIAGLVVVAALALAACGGEEEETPGGTTGGGEPKAGGVYNHPLGAEPVYVDPLNGNYEVEGTMVEHQIFEGLVAYDQKDKNSPITVVPRIAEKWESNADATVWTFYLKKGVMFQPPVSREVTAQDFKDEWERVTLEENGSATSYVLAVIKGVNDSGYMDDPAQGIPGVKVIDDYTLEVTLDYPFAEFPVTLGHAVAAVAPVEYIKEVGQKAFNTKPVGTGPYMMDKWVANQYLDLVKNPDYWDTENRGYVDRIHMAIIPDDQTMLLEFKNGNTDYTEIPAGQIISTQQDPNVENGKWNWSRYPGMDVYFVGFDMTDETLGYPAGEKGTALRSALVMSSDKQAVNTQVNEGVNTIADGVVPNTVSGYQPGADPYAEYDVAKAKEIVDGLGTLPTFDYWYNTEVSGHQKIGEVLQAGWKQIGVDVKLQGFEWGTLLAKLTKREGQIFRMGWVADYPSIDNFLYPLFQSDVSKTGSFTSYNNPEVDRLLTEARATLDEDERNAKYVEIEKIIMADAPVSVLYWYGNPRITSTRIGGFLYNAVGFVDMWKIWVK